MWREQEQKYGYKTSMTATQSQTGNQKLELELQAWVSPRSNICEYDWAREDAWKIVTTYYDRHLCSSQSPGQTALQQVLFVMPPYTVSDLSPSYVSFMFQNFSCDYELSPKQCSEVVAYEQLLLEKLYPALVYLWWVASELHNIHSTSIQACPKMV